MIGIVDYDFSSAKKGLPPPSLAAMKTSAYLKMEQKDGVYLVTDIDKLKNYNEIYFFSDKPVENIPKEIFLLENIHLYGKFLENIPQIIEHMTADISIYYDIIQDKLSKKIISTDKAIQFLDSIYYQAYGSNGERLPLPPSPKRKRFYLYDEDFLKNEKCWDIFKEIGERIPSGIYTVNPIQCHTLKQFFMLREEYEKVSRSNKIILDYFIPFHHFDVYFGKYKLKLLGEITKKSEVYIYLGKNYSARAYGQIFYLKNLFYCLNLIFSYWSRNIPIKAEMYIAEGAINPYKEIFTNLRLWTNSSNLEAKLSDYFVSKKSKENLNDFLKENLEFEIFFNKTKNDLINTRGVWRLP